MGIVIQFPVDTTKIKLTKAQEKVVDKIKEMLDEDENWMMEYHTENEDCSHAEHAMETAETDFDTIVENISKEICEYDRSLFDYLTSIMSSDKQEDFVEWVHAHADLVHMSGWCSEPYGIVLGSCPVGEVESEIRQDIKELAEANNINLEHETFSQYSINRGYMYVDLSYETWYFRLDDCYYEDALEYLKELNVRRDD